MYLIRCGRIQRTSLDDNLQIVRQVRAYRFNKNKGLPTHCNTQILSSGCELCDYRVTALLCNYVDGLLKGLE